MITITVHGNAESVLSATAQAAANSRPLLGAAQAAVVDGLKRHFLARNGEPNRMGWAKRNLWTTEGVEKTAPGALTATSAEVRVSSPIIAHKLTGGTIRPGPGRRALAIPVDEEAYLAGQPSLKVIPNLKLVKVGPKGRQTAVLAQDTGHDQLEIKYRLVPAVTQPADPRTLPPPDTLAQAAGDAAAAALARQVRRAAAAPATPS